MAISYRTKGNREVPLSFDIKTLLNDQPLGEQSGKSSVNYKGKIIIPFLDEKDNILQSPLVKEGIVTTPYDVSKDYPEIKGYYPIKNSSKDTGIYLPDEQTIVHRYKKQAVRQEISEQNILINDSFVAYIALHFLVSYEREEDLRSVRAVYICSTGLGVTSLIKQKINEELNNITIVAFASVLNAQEMIATKDPDLVISIFPINGIDRPFIKVHPLPTEQDLKKIQQIIKKY